MAKNMAFDPNASLFNGAQGVVVRWATRDGFARAISDGRLSR